MGAMSQDAVDALVKLLDLEPIEVNIFRGLSPDEDRQRVPEGLHRVVSRGDERPRGHRRGQKEEQSVAAEIRAPRR